jgi:hypothetical protein
VVDVVAGLTVTEVGAELLVSKLESPYWATKLKVPMLYWGIAHEPVATP